MTKYLLRRRNKFGQYVHLTTYDYEPTETLIRSQFGPGQYVIMIAEEGIIGLRKLRDVMIPWDIRLLEWVEGQPTLDYVKKKWGEGNYFVLRNCKIDAFQIYPTQEEPKTTWDFLQDGKGAMTDISVIFKVEGLPWI